MILIVASPRSADAARREWVFVEMSDSVLLSTLLIRPDAGNGPWPAILLRTPYTDLGGNTDAIDDAFDLIAMLGFVVVYQEARGFGASEGDRMPFFPDAVDGGETIDWITAQPWSDGEVMMIGASALAIPGYLVAPDAPDEMVCQALAIATPDVYSAAFEGGVYKRSDVEAWSRWIDAPEVADELITHRNCDAFWDTVRMQNRGADVRSAAVHIGGWFDPFAEGVILGFHMYRDATEPWVARHQYLIMGPWSHHELGQSSVGELSLPESAALDYMTEGFAWLRWCLGAGDASVEAWPPVRYYVLGDVDDPDAPGNEWREARDWPPCATEERPLFLDGDGGLVWETPETDASFERCFDPADPSPTVGGRNLSLARGPRDQASVEARGDALVFSSAPLEEPIEVIGRVRTRLRVVPEGADLDVVVRLTDVYPDGRSMLVLDSVQRLSRREGCAGSVEVAAGAPLDVTVELGTTAYAFNTGHRLRLIVTPSNYPRFELNPTLTERTRYAVLVGPSSEAALLLPVPVPGDPGAEVVEEAEVADAAEIVEPMPVVEPFDVVEPGLDTINSEIIDHLEVAGPSRLDAEPAPDEQGVTDIAADETAEKIDAAGVLPMQDAARADRVSLSDAFLPDSSLNRSERDHSGSGCGVGGGAHGLPGLLLILLLAGVYRASLRSDRPAFTLWR